ncbi:MAG TPA: hypothetical protein VJ892_01195, partial [Candidatus Absconditabacterales bacterium]|nr:hypothetical protein [Candidatus Absconditabacterales bacterium]
MKNVKKIMIVVVMVNVLVMILSSCTDEYEMPKFDRVDQVESIEYGTTYSVEGVSKLKIYLSFNEQYDCVSFTAGNGTFLKTDENGTGYWFIQNDTLYVDVDPDWNVCKF